MKNSPSFRALAMLLCVQPVLWMSNTALAQSFDELKGRSRNEESGAGRQAETTSPMAAEPSLPDVSAVNRATTTGNVARPPPIDAPVDPDVYRLAAGDVLDLNFWGLQNFTVRVTLDVEGRAFVPKVGYFSLQGKTLTEARRMMRESIARLYRLNFGVTLAEPRTFLVQVVGAVVRPGSYPARATERVASVIAKAGGLQPNGSRRRIDIERRGDGHIASDLLLYEIAGDVKHNPFLLDGDVVRVPYQDLVANIGGAVNRPGRYELTTTRDSAELLQLAGGPAPGGTTLLPVRVVRRTPQARDEQKEFPFTADGNVPSFAIEDEDTITLPLFSELQRMITVVGAIAGATTARTLGPTAQGAVSSSANVAITPEEASATRHVPFVEGDTVRTLLDRMGGVGPLADLKGTYIIRGASTVPVDLYAIMMLGDFKADRRIELGDTVVVPFRRRNILVEGAVFAPGSYPYNPDFKIEQYLSIAGGRNRFAQPLGDVRVVTPRGETKDYRPDVTVEPGSSIVVPERNFSRSEVVQILLGVAGVLLSGVAVIITATK